MANKTINDLTPAGAIADADKIEIQASPFGAVSSFSATWTLIKSFLKTYFDSLYDATGAAAARMAKVPTATENNIATFDAAGQVKDGGAPGGASYLVENATKTNSIKATGSFNANGGNGNIGDTCSIGSGGELETWTFVAARGAAFQVTIGLDGKTSMQNLVNAIVADSAYTDSTWDGNNVCNLQAKVAGAAGNRALNVVSSKFGKSGATMTGGTDGSAAGAYNGQLSFNTSGLFVWDTASGKWKKATLADA